MSTLNQIEYKIQDLGSIDGQCALWKEKKVKTVFTNGVFDLLHRGHIDYLSKAAELGNKLIIGLNSDESVRKLAKGPARPIKDEYSRALILASLFFVDAVVIFGESTPRKLIKVISPDVLVKGGDYDADAENPHNEGYIVGSDHVKKQGGSVRVIPFLPGYSTTDLEKKIIRSHQNR